MKDSRKQRRKDDAQRRNRIGDKMVGDAVDQGFTPVIVIAGKPINQESGEVEYSVYSPLRKDFVRKVMLAALGLEDDECPED